MSGLIGEAGQAWAERNGLTPPLAFSHNLAEIFPPALHAQHPEFFPLVNGERMRPRDGAQNWNPDLGREDVAAWTADAARRQFDAHPDSEGFSVGVNDGLIFGDSAETMAALRRNKPRADETMVQRQKEGSGGRNQRSEPSDLHRTNAGDVQFRSDLLEQEAIRGRSESDRPIRNLSRPFSVCPRVVSCENQTIAWFRQRPDFSNLVFGFTNRVAREVARMHPGKYVGALAYYWCENAPDSPLEPNVIPFLTADRSQGYDEAFRREELALQQRWADLGGRWVGSGASSRSTLSSQYATSDQGWSAHGRRGTHEKRNKEEERAKREDAKQAKEQSAVARWIPETRDLKPVGAAVNIRQPMQDGSVDDQSRYPLGSTPVKRMDRAFGSQHSALSFGVHRRNTEDEPSTESSLAGEQSGGQWTVDGERRAESGGRDRRPSTVDGAPLSRRLGLYDYLYGSGFLIPRIHTRLIADNLRQARRLGFTDYFAEVNPNWGLDGPMPWLVAQLLQDPEQSREVLLEEYYQGCFGDAAVPMRRFFERCEQQWMHQPGRGYWLKHFRNESQAQVFPSAVCRELRALLDEAARQARGASVQTRVRFVSDAFGVTERFVVFCEARDALNRAVLARETHELSAKARSGEGRSEGGSTAGHGMVAHGTHGIYENQREEIEPMAAGSALRSVRPPGDGPVEDQSRYPLGSTPVITKPVQVGSVLNRRQTEDEPSKESSGALEQSGREWTVNGGRGEGSGASDLSTLSAQHSTPGQGRCAHEIHRTHEKEEERRARYWAAREEFIGYTKALMAREPQALVPFRWEDYLRHEPPALDGGRWTVDGEGGAENLLSNGDLRGPLQAPKRIAGLDYGVAMPAGWITTVEPAEGQSARVEDGVLRLERNKETFVYQWLPATPGAEYRATVQVRGQVQPSATASLTLSWLDERQVPLGFKVHRLPEGAWPDWVTLEVAQDLPAAARWIGTGVRVQHQLDGDWLEVRAVRLERVR